LQKNTSQVRIIAGKWRSRKITFVPIKGLRPTTDAVRETLFNWLAPYIQDANCLDLFAGSGCLGFEALSRGAKHVVMVDAATQVMAMLKHNAQELNCQAIDFYCAKIPQNINKIPTQSFDIVFLDPPFNSKLIGPVCEKLLNSNYLAKDALVYIEVEKDLNLPAIVPQSWQILRQKITGQIGCYLIKI